MSAGPWADRAHLRSVQYKNEANLAARQSIYAFQHPPVDLTARVLDLAAPAQSDTIADIGCGNGRYLAELARRGFPGRVVGADLSLGMLQAARAHLAAAAASVSPAHTSTAAVSAAAAASAASFTMAVTAAASAAFEDCDAAAACPSMALICADATALPLRDGVADLALASHMLYHVPDPADALRELRRVTRPGGRVIIVLNGATHLGQLREALATASGVDPSTLRERVSLDDGESLARSFFTRVTRHDFPAQLRIPDSAPVADYIRSLPGHQQPAGQDPLIAAVISALPVTPDGHYVITTHAGCLIADLA